MKKVPLNHLGYFNDMVQKGLVFQEYFCSSMKKSDPEGNYKSLTSQRYKNSNNENLESQDDE